MIKHTVIYAGMSLLIFCLPAMGGSTWYVNASGSAGGSGSSWASPYTNLQQALSSAASNDWIWVAQGTYTPTNGTNRLASFMLKPGVELYGGFTNGGTSLASRDWTNRPAILSGNIGNSGTATDNCYSVVQGTNNALLDGFTIQDGYAEKQYSYDHGAGMNINAQSPTIRNCLFRNNYAYTSGGGVAFLTAGATGLVENCVFTNNTALSGPGLASFNSATPTIRNCRFMFNAANGGGGIAIGNGLVSDMASAVILNCSFISNSLGDGSASSLAGGLSIASGSPLVSNCWFEGNYNVYRGGGIYISSFADAPTITDCRFFRNTCNSGGGGKNGGGIWAGGAASLIQNCLFVRNVAGNGGGGIMNQAGVAGATVIRNCSFLNNISGTGGGIGSESSPTVVSNCLFLGNSTGYGGGVYSSDSSTHTFPAPVFLYNCLIAGNQLGSVTFNRGGGIYLEAGTGLVENCTVTDNMAGDFGGGIGNTSILTNRNAILWNNWDRNSATNELWNGVSGSSATFAYSDVRGGWNGIGISNAAGAATLDGGGNRNGNPLFTTVATGTWSVNGTYDIPSTQTILTDANAAWTSGALAGFVVNPKTTQYLRFLIVTNSATNLVIWGDASAISSNGFAYTIVDYKLVRGSPCIDTGQNQGWMFNALDLSGRRRVDRLSGIVDMGAYEAMRSGATFSFR